ncbi:hypothetical protein [Paenisporosarcina cavernae]|uniref:Uncharacterized protein n=1 Tax=Paenisporosarcina cavernae TaxID=2320858 RepID=A0A385YVR6_9BACL|nr:hypothetical protein [Paenisporosarcina cavernae]AYC29672.1 hypothetical protein D3873_07125 [Paenisporosarcina cavernae]AYC30035.1 hypothetical protein D3873_09175 [Paenisporosarcina cavernae]
METPSEYAGLSREDVLKALAEWIVSVSLKKEQATPEEIQALPKVAHVYLENYSITQINKLSEEFEPETSEGKCHGELASPGTK